MWGRARGDERAMYDTDTSSFITLAHRAIDRTIRGRRENSMKENSGDRQPRSTAYRVENGVGVAYRVEIGAIPHLPKALLPTFSRWTTGTKEG